MSTYAIGDVQGCFRTFERLLARIDFQIDRDRLWLVGDVVNRGPRSLETLRFAMAHEDQVTMVLGNHDLHLLARYLGVSPERRTDTLEDILHAPDRDAIFEWLRRRPLLHQASQFLMVHAGLMPEWNEAEAVDRAASAEGALRSGSIETLLFAIRNKSGFKTKDRLLGDQVETIRAMTRIRTLDEKLRPNFDFAGAPSEAPARHRPWFDAPHRRQRESVVVFGHWAALGCLIRPDILALDSGCVWGRWLTAVRLEDRAIFEEPFGD